MFDDKFFEQWLDNQAHRVMNLVGDGKAISPEEMMVLVLKAQTNHFAHLDIELREEIQGLREDMDKRFDLMREEMDKRFDLMREEMSKRFEQVDKRFEHVDKRFEQVDKHFEQVEKRFEALTIRIDRFMIWSFATTLSVGGIVIAAIKFLP
ncbi:MAG: hypothetical protein Q8N35_11900 [Methylococcaceae bacterium]|nr:hypothetical protein [Methylococcaceae bacterium]MDZ4156708.1 hypothetical protein [Methylococcales bacterium]MDP2394858.1 hypothetical protein [Methylococcaceae bacterium]MDP3020279.1 hypothetical protein [Methylococcaceae bacterium]MDP3390820.1 hypothetical protein [Methylococcaceae bacterium]